MSNFYLASVRMVASTVVSSYLTAHLEYKCTRKFVMNALSTYLSSPQEETIRIKEIQTASGGSKSVHCYLRGKVLRKVLGSTFMNILHLTQVAFSSHCRQLHYFVSSGWICQCVLVYICRHSKVIRNKRFTKGKLGEIKGKTKGKWESCN